jgi:hypothetical protein
MSKPYNSKLSVAFSSITEVARSIERGVFVLSLGYSSFLIKRPITEKKMFSNKLIIISVIDLPSSLL